MKRLVLILGLEKFRVQLSSISGPKKLVPSGIKTSNPLFFVSPFAFCIIVYVSYSVHNKNVHSEEIRKRFPKQVNILQGVPRNMGIERRLESRL